MQLSFNRQIASGYSSNAQIARVLSESWVKESMFCPNCGGFNIEKYQNNKPVADFYCDACKEVYELKSKKLKFGSKVVDGAYKTMIERLTSNNVPSIFLLTYNNTQITFDVSNFFVIPKHFFVPAIIEKRNSLSITARRAGWTGCNIVLKNIPDIGKIFIVKNNKIQPKEKVCSQWERTRFLRETATFSTKNWLLDIMLCIEKTGKQTFSLQDIYSFEHELGSAHPDNKHIKAKIRQQLQVLRDKEYICFTSRGNYKRI